MAYELLTPEEMYRADALAEAHGVSALKLMENAGVAVATEIIRRWKKCAVVVLCGPGNNGGDGFVVARVLKAKGWPVRLFLLGETAKLKGNAATMAHKWKGKTEAMGDFAKATAGKQPPALVVDALFGAGLSRDFPQVIADEVKRAAVPVVAVDVPSGLDGLTGKPRGAAIKANLTVTFYRKKPGHMLLPGRSICGEVVVADIGLPEKVISTLNIKLWENARPILPDLAVDTHKYKRGHALILSGPEFNTGAARLAAWACARVGAGLTSIVGAPEALRVHASHVSSIMLKSYDGLDALMADRRVSACCFGPAAGVTEETRQLAFKLLSGQPGVVLDADALSAFEAAPETLFIAIRKRQGRPVVLTPHEGEFSKLFLGLSVKAESKLEFARAAAKHSGATVLLKGADTVIAAPDGRAKINSNAPPRLATAGSGDVLAGIITGLMAQGLDGFAAACAGAWLHGDAAMRVKRRTLIAEDLVEKLGMETK
jgi:hydroxyethylthiazole kinase-like uncharacterized protein yjeF